MSKTKVNSFTDNYDKSTTQLFDTTQSDKFYNKLDNFQYEAYHCLVSKNHNIIMFDESAGCGKTTLAWLAGLNLLRTGQVSKIFYIRLPDIRALKQGFLPGDLEDKESVFMYPAYDACLINGLQPQAVDDLRRKGLIEFCSDATLRGRNIDDAFVIIDECQNADIESLQLILTRLHDNCKCVLSGHSGQMDNKSKKYGKSKLNAFEVYQLHLLKKTWSVKCALPINYRGKISKWSDEINKTINELE